jgi:hypothetical protein
MTFQVAPGTQLQAIAHEQKLSTDPFGPRGGHRFPARKRGSERMPDGIRVGEMVGDAQVICAAPWPKSAWAYSPARGFVLVEVPA